MGYDRCIKTGSAREGPGSVLIVSRLRRETLYREQEAEPTDAKSSRYSGQLAAEPAVERQLILLIKITLAPCSINQQISSSLKQLIYHCIDIGDGGAALGGFVDSDVVVNMHHDSVSGVFDAGYGFSMRREALSATRETGN